MKRRPKVSSVKRSASAPTINNYTAKHTGLVNRAATMVDRKKQNAKGHRKHRGGEYSLIELICNLIK